MGLLIAGLISTPSFADYEIQKQQKSHHHKPKQQQTTVVTNSNVTATINNIIANAPSNVDIGVMVKDLNTGQVIYSKDSDRNFVPASTLKLFTSIAALTYFGPNYRYQTTISTNTNQLHNGILPGNLYVQFNGDPSLGYADLVQLVQKVKASGITQVEGHVYIDDKALGNPSFGPGWMWDDTTICYSAPVSAVVINRNCFQVNAVPGTSLGAPVTVQGLGSFPFAKFTNNTMTKSGYDPNCPLTLRASLDNHYLLDGCLPLKAGPQSLDIAIQNPPQAAIVELGRVFAAQGITINGSIELGHDNATLYQIATHSSPPLTELLKHMLKVSDNLYANTIFKTLGHAYTHGTGTWHNSATAVQQILGNTAGVNFHHATIVDGSGLSRYNLITPAQLVEALSYAHAHFPADYQFPNLLPISGIDGTLKFRLGTKDTLGRIHAKTGTLDDMTNLAGYITAANGHTLAFAILINNTPKPIMAYEIVTNRICTYLATSGSV